MRRLYIISYKMFEAQGGSFKYASNPKSSEKTETYSREEREMFFRRWEYLHKDDLQFVNIQAHYADLDSNKLVELKQKHIDKLKQQP